MIQRKQSIWLLIATLLNSGVFYFDIYRAHTLSHVMVNGADQVNDSLLAVRVSEDFPSLLIALLMTLLPLLAIFLFRQRKRQMNLVLFSALAIVSFVTLILVRVSNLGKMPSAPTGGSYWVGAVLPVAALVFLIMAAMGIRRDEKLVRSVDRLR